MDEFKLGDIVKVIGEQGEFKVLGIRKNGDVDCWGGLGGAAGLRRTTGHAQYRTFRAERLRKVKK